MGWDAATIGGFLSQPLNSSSPAKRYPAAAEPDPDPDALKRGDRNVPQPPANDSEPKWAPWKVTLSVIVFCAAFWAGVIWLGMRLFGGH